MIKFFIVVLILFLFNACTDEALIKKKQDFENHIVKTQSKLTGDEEGNQQSYIKIVSSKEAFLDKKIKQFFIKDASLKEILTLIFPDAYIVTEGKGINLNKSLIVDARNINYAEFLELLSSLSGYRIYLEKSNKLVISSVAYRRWNVASLVSLPEVKTTVGGNAVAGDTGNSTEITLEKDNEDNTVWTDLISGIEKILGKNGVVVDNLRLGEIYASGNPDKLILADQWMKKIVESSTRQVLLDVAILEITLNDGQATGLDWNAIYTKDANSSISLGRTTAKSLVDGGAWDLVANYVEGKFKLTALVNLLKQHGKVSVQHQPSLTVTNGSTAYLSSSEHSSYIAGITRERTITDGIIQVDTTLDIQEINIGVSIAVTARILENDKILIEVVPVISSLQKFDDISFSDNEDTQVTTTPRINLQELSTQVITKSGQAVHLGGLIFEKLSEASSKAPGLLGWIGNSKNQQLEKKEILVIITPTEI